MDQIKVTVVLVASGHPDGFLDSRPDGFLNSISSVISQDTQIFSDLVIVSEPDSNNEFRYQKILEKNPWIPSARFVFCSLDELTLTVSAQTDADYLMFLSIGDELLPGAISSMVEAVSVPGSKTVYGACRWSDGHRSWAHPAIDRFFELPSIAHITPSLLFDVIQTTAFGMYHRSLFKKNTFAGLEQALIVKEYVCLRWQSVHVAYQLTYRYHKKMQGYNTPIIPARFPVVREISQDKKDGIWIFGERRGVSAEDNAWALFQYCVDNCPEIHSYYVLNEEERSVSKPDRYQSRILIKGSSRWREQLKQASHFFFTDSAEDILLSAIDATNYRDVVFVYLTHGYLGYSPGVYQRGHRYIDRVVCSCQVEIDAASRAWDFPKSKFIRCGLPRWDSLADSASSRREILVCPTWRKVFNSLHWSEADEITEEDISTFKSSVYFTRFYSFLQSESLNALLEKHDSYITFNLHFRLKNYLPLFDHELGSRVKIASQETDGRSIRELMQDASLLITDYSSIMFDMGQMEKPVICYQFDKAAMMGERKIDSFTTPDSQMFANICSTESEVIQRLEVILESNFAVGEEDIRKLNSCLPYRDRENCKRLVDAITGTTNIRKPEETSTDQTIKEPAVESYLERINAVQLDASTRVGYILNVNNSGSPTHIELNPDNWKEIITKGGIDLLVIEPHLNAESCWAPVFFIPEKLTALFVEITDLARQHRVKTVLFGPEFHLYFKNSSHSLAGFDQFIALPPTEYSRSLCDISVIIPAYNSDQFLSRCIDSILNQDFAGTFEVIIINDGSTDNTQEIISGYSGIHLNVIGINQCNSRQGIARNRGLMAARGEYVTFLDADDVLPANCLSDLLHKVRLTGADVSIGLVASSDETGQTQRINQSYFHYSKAPQTFTSNSWPHVFYDPSCVGKLISRRFLLEHRIFFPQSYHEDQVFNFSLFAKASKIAKTNSVVYLYTARPVANALSGTQTFSSEKLRQILLAAHLAQWILEESNLSSRIKNYALGFLVIRYDRFIWKQKSLSMDDESCSTQKQALGFLASFLSSVPDEMVWTSARYSPLEFLLLKRHMSDLYAKAGRGSKEDAIDFFNNENKIPEYVLEVLKEGGTLASSYSYFKAVTITKTGVKQTELITEMSYGYRLGSVFVDGAKQPIQIFLVPFRVIHLAFDMLTRRGRKKQKIFEQKMIDSCTDSQTMIDHSNVIGKTASYRLGVAIMEAFTTSPVAIIKLPKKIKQIYVQTS